MLREQLHWFGGSASSTITVSAPAPVYDAQLVPSSVPSTMTAGSYYDVSMTFKNTGNVTWTSPDYLLGNADDLTTFGISRVAMSVASVAPGQSAVFNFQLRAPATPGSYTTQWGMLWEYHMRFGQTSRTNVTVNPATTTPQPTISVSRPALVAGQSFTTTWSTTNATSLKHVCTASGTGYAVNESLALNGSRSLTAQSAWVGYPSSCTWTASGAGGSAIYTETMSTAAGSNGSVTYIHTDGLGSPIARTDAAGKVISRTRYEPYGYVASGVQPTIGFTGHVNDADTGLTYMQQRYYDPVAGRFLSIDPVATDANTAASFNRYAYANNSPYQYIDPDGRNPLLLAPVVGALIGGGINAAIQYESTGTVRWGGIGGVLDAAGDGAMFGMLGLGASLASSEQSVPRAMSTLQANKAAGAAFQNKVAEQLAKTQTGVVQEVTVKTATGVKTRIDIMGRDAKGNIVCTECKASATAPLTKNQAAAHPQIQQSGAVVVGKGKPGFPGGTTIPPTKVDVVRP